LGAVFLDESVTVATVVGFALVMTGCWLATRPSPVVESSGERDENPGLVTSNPA